MYLSQQARKKKKTSFEKLSTLHILYATKVIRQVVRECLSVFSIKDAKFFFSNGYNITCGRMCRNRRMDWNGKLT